MPYAAMIAVAAACSVAAGDDATNGITILTIEHAKALVQQHKHGLALNGLTTLSDEAAMVLRANPNIALPDTFKQ